MKYRGEPTVAGCLFGLFMLATFATAIAVVAAVIFKLAWRVFSWL